MKINYKNLNHIEFELKKFKDSGLLIVTKNQKIDEIKELILKGYKIFGENRVQEALQKYSGLSNPNNIELHLIGPLQTNKVKSALQLFDVIQSIDRISLVDSIVKKINSLEKTRTKEFYIQVNIGEEYQKGGVAKKDLSNLFQYCLKNNLKINGLMCIPPNIADPSKYFLEMKEIRNNIDRSLKLSMGMSNDYKIALKFDSNIIRIGSMIFQ